MNVDPKPSRRFAEYVRKIVCDEWECLGRRGNDHGVLRHTSGVTVYYLVHDGGNDWNGPRNFAVAVQKACGCKLIEPRGRKKSRKTLAPGVDPGLVAARRRHAVDYEIRAGAQRAERAAEQAREQDIRATEAADRRRREIEDLMRP